ncbi:MAG TPA: DUF6152 family protein [Rhizomicrobium sp.]|jgi:hypothetical protein|nr:DUF6152 family protein [Rhizomicrobium sp.]
MTLPLRLSLGAGLVAAATLAGAPASAHHGWAGNVDEVTDMTGTVVEGVRLAGPHATMKVKVGGDVWDITLAPPARAERAGLKEGLIPVGATVTVRGNRNRDAARHEMKTIMVRYGERQFDVYPERE